MVDRVKPRVMVYGSVHGSVHDFVHGAVHGLVNGFWFMVPSNIEITHNSDLDLGSGYDSVLPIETGHLTEKGCTAV